MWEDTCPAVLGGFCTRSAEVEDWYAANMETGGAIQGVHTEWVPRPLILYRIHTAWCSWPDKLKTITTKTTFLLKTRHYIKILSRRLGRAKPSRCGYQGPRVDNLLQPFTPRKERPTPLSAPSTLSFHSGTGPMWAPSWHPPEESYLGHQAAFLVSNRAFEE